MTGDHACNAFPSQKHQIDHLCATSNVFADLFDDYDEVVAMLERLDSTQPDAKPGIKPDNRSAEFAQLERQLRQEIARILESVVIGPGLSCQARD